ncbi:MAG: cation diffusion facilitator family transporter [Planctomycetota bacterium]|jgi:cation diffusion facilitator family transporter
MSPSISTRRVVTISLLVDILDVVSCLVVALVTGSAAVFAEMAQGLADVVGSLCLVLGERRARRPRDARHPFGYGREAFFWSLLSAVAMLGLGGGLSLWRGQQQLLHPEPLEAAWLAVAVLALSVVTNGYAVALSLAKLRAEEGTLRHAFSESNRPLVKSALLRDIVGTASAVLGLVALTLYQLTGSTVFDAAGALIVAAMMTVLSLVLIGQARVLITGRAISEHDLERVRAAVEATPGVDALNHASAVWSGSRDVVVALDLDLAEGLTTPEIEALLDALQLRIRAAVPETETVRVDLNSPALQGRTASPSKAR